MIKITKQCLVYSVLIFALFTLFVACNRTKEAKTPPTISEIMSSRLPKEKVRAGEKVELYVDISNPSNIPLKFDWSVTNGAGIIDLSSGSTRVTYQAPEAEGQATVRLEVRDAKNFIVTRTLQLQIVPKSPSVDVIANFVFAGWMGDGETFGTRAITLDDRYRENPHSPPACVRITYRILPESVGWAGIYAQYNVREEGQNWGTHPGRDLTGYTKLVWWAKGETGNEMVEFKAGGIDATSRDSRYRYKDSFEIILGTVRLERTWKRYELDLTEYDLSSVIGGFCWVATARANPNGLTFYVDSITYE